MDNVESPNDLTTHRIAVSYIDKSRDFYSAQGYGKPYRWASNLETPFTRLKKPLNESRVGLVTTATIPKPGVSLEYDPGLLKTTALFSAPSDPTPEALYTMDRSWDKDATHTMDLGSFFPLDHLKSFVDQKIIGSVSPRFYGVPTDYSQSRTSKKYAPEIYKQMQEDKVDIALLVPL